MSLAVGTGVLVAEKPASLAVMRSMTLDQPRDHCGVVGVSLDPHGESYDAIRKTPAAHKVYWALRGLQHRGLDSSGIATKDSRLGSKIRVERIPGLVTELERKMEYLDSKTHKLKKQRTSALDRLRGNEGIGHVRYATVGTTNVCDAQPIVVRENGMHFAMAFNGNLVNVLELRKVARAGHKFEGKGDGEVLAATFAREYRRGRDVETAFTELQKQVDGSYSIVLLTQDRVVAAFRDQYGLRPLSMGKGDDGIMFASESVALLNGGFGYWRDVRPGELIIASDWGQSVEKRQIGAVVNPAHCMFEFVYFSNPVSIMEGQNVAQVRYRLGQELAKEYGGGADADFIVGLPDTGRTGAEGVASVLGLPIRESAMIKDRFIVLRSFLQSKQEDRDETAGLKFHPNTSILRGKKVIVVDDSIVRGTTLRRRVAAMRAAGATRVEVWITCPPIVSVCVYGIDMSNPKELAAKGLSAEDKEQVRQAIGADRLCYLSNEGLTRAIGLPTCWGCLQGEYPTLYAQKLVDSTVGLNIAGRVTEYKPLKALATPKPVSSTTSQN